MTGNHWSSTNSDPLARRLQDPGAGAGAEHITIRAHCPWQNARVERFNCTLKTNRPTDRSSHSNGERTEALDP